MGKIIQDIWVLKDEGVVIFKRVFEERVDAQLFGGFFSALNAFAANLDKGGINNFELSDKKFFIVKQNNLIFIVNSDKKVKAKDAQTELDKIIKRFFDCYPPEMLKSWDGNTSFFDNFTKKIEDSLEDVIKNFQNAFW
jgi:hypothetical protein